MAARAGSGFRRQADEYIINKHAVVIQGSARRFISRQKMAARIEAVAREVKFVLARRITPHVRGHLVRAAFAATLQAKGAGESRNMQNKARNL